MPMIKIRLRCGHQSIWHYKHRIAWEALPSETQKLIVEQAHAAHTCPPKPAPKAPSTSPEPQRP